MKLGTLLRSVGYTEPSTFGELCQALGGDCPTESSEWRQFFGLVKSAEDEGLVEVERDDGKISSIQLTEMGVSELTKIGRLT